MLLVRVVSAPRIDATYADLGKGPGTSVLVRLQQPIKGGIPLKSGTIFSVHSFPGQKTATVDYAAEKLQIGRRYLLFYPYSLDVEGRNTTAALQDGIGLTRCGVVIDSIAAEKQIRQALLERQRESFAELPPTFNW